MGIPASFFVDLGIPAANMTKWGRKETSRTSEYPEVLQHDIFVNCISIFAPVPPFLTMASLEAPDRCLSVVCDISTDSKSPNNTVQIYRDFTSDKQPTLQVPVRPLPSSTSGASTGCGANWSRCTTTRLPRFRSRSPWQCCS